MSEVISEIRVVGFFRRDNGAPVSILRGTLDGLAYFMESGHADTVDLTDTVYQDVEIASQLPNKSDLDLNEEPL